MGLGVYVAAGAVSALGTWCMVHREAFGSRTLCCGSLTALKMFGGTVVLIFAQFLGLLPRPAASLVARLLHGPDDIYFFLTKSRPFNFTRVENNLIVGRMPCTHTDLITLCKVCKPRPKLTPRTSPCELFLC